MCSCRKYDSMWHAQGGNVGNGPLLLLAPGKYPPQSYHDRFYPHILAPMSRGNYCAMCWYPNIIISNMCPLSLRSDDNDDSDDEAVKSIGGDDNATSFLQPLSCLFLIALAARRSQEGNRPLLQTNGECTSFAFKKLPKAREVRNADLYDLSLASRNFCTNGPNLCCSWIPIPSVIPSPLKKGGHSVNAIFASHPFTHSCQARHQGANDFEYTESAAYMAFEVDELEVPMHRGAVAFSTSTPPIGEAPILRRSLRRHRLPHHINDLNGVPDWGGKSPRILLPSPGAIVETPKAANMHPKLHPLIQ
ncbi:hypothetical protein BKA70DRAFT_1240500 [Coprinopsis sp. MPI-PUGE-AT-0042]|nr:hypothetical protein BKA70DRAFT_1240500 [Coprinopsis sp. MPI-PUGE-AT-0042]